ITDASQASVPGGTITVTNTDTGVHRTVKSNADGLYNVPLLRPGPYRVAVEKTGFQEIVRGNVRLQVGEVLRLDLSLQIGSMKQAVEVTGAPPLLESETSSMG